MEPCREEIVFYRKRLGLRFKAVRCADGAQKIVVVGMDEQYRNAGSSSEQLLALGLERKSGSMVRSSSSSITTTSSSSMKSKRISVNGANKIFATDVYDASQLEWASSDTCDEEKNADEINGEPLLASFSVDPFEGDQQVSVTSLHISKRNGMTTALSADDADIQLQDGDNRLCLLVQVGDGEPVEYRLDRSKCGNLFDFKDELSRLLQTDTLPANLSLEYYMYAASSPSYKPLDHDGFPFFVGHSRRKVRVRSSSSSSNSDSFVSSSSIRSSDCVPECMCAWSPDNAWPTAGSIVYSCNGVKVTGLDSEFQMGLLKSQVRPLHVQFLPPTQETVALSLAESDVEGQSTPSSSFSKSERRSSSSAPNSGRVRYSTFVHKFNHPLAAKLRKRIEELLAEYIVCDWDAARREGERRVYTTPSR